jgi:hypothetical protein
VHLDFSLLPTLPGPGCISNAVISQAQSPPSSLAGLLVDAALNNSDYHLCQVTKKLEFSSLEGILSKRIP